MLICVHWFTGNSWTSTVTFTHIPQTILYYCNIFCSFQVYPCFHSFDVWGFLGDTLNNAMSFKGAHSHNGLSDCDDCFGLVMNCLTTVVHSSLEHFNTCQTEVGT